MQPYARRENLMKLIAEREQHVAAVRAMNEEGNAQRVRSQFGITTVVPAEAAYPAEQAGAAAAMAGPRRQATLVAQEEHNMKHIRNMLRDQTTVGEEARARQVQLARVPTRGIVPRARSR